MAQTNINLIRTEDNYVTYDGNPTKVVETSDNYINYFFFSATSINYAESTMVLSYDDYSGWRPTACLAIINTNPSGQMYAIKVTVPKFYSTEQETEHRNIYVRGNIQTDSPLINSNYDLAIKANGCVEAEKYALRYTTEYGSGHTEIEDTNIVFNTLFIVNRNIEFFNGSDDGHGKNESKMLNIVARNIWGDKDSDFARYTTDYTQASYNSACTGNEKNEYIYRNDNVIELGAGFFKMEGDTPVRLDVAGHNYISEKEGEFVFNEPLEAIGYHTFFFGSHYNGRTTAPKGPNDYIEYKDNHNNYYSFSGNENSNIDNKLRCARTSNDNQCQYLFDDYENITSIKTGKYIKIIGNQAFKALKKLASIDFQGSNVERIGMFAFEETSELETIDIPETVVLIGEGAFKRSGITGVTIPSGLEIIEEETFRKCENLTEVRFAEGSTLEKISANAFRGCNNINFGSISLPASLKRIERMAFAECDGLHNVNFNGVLDYIGYRAFYKCGSLASISITAKVIGIRAFEKCDSLRDVTIKSSVRTVKKLAFYESEVNSLTIENGLTTIESNAFYKTKSLTGVTLPDSVTTLGDRAFNNCCDLVELKIGNGLSVIGEHAFDGCNLTAVTLGNSITTIKEAAFRYSNFTSITLPNSLVTIGPKTFAGCQYLSSIVIPKSVRVIENCAFDNCYGLASITYKGTSSQWRSISIDDDWCGGIQATQVYCEADGKYVDI